MDYSGIRRIKDAATRRQIIDSLGRLRAGLAEDVPIKSPSNLLLASRNIREFGGSRYGGRTKEAIYCIAECLNHFDLIAVQEVRSDLAALKEVMGLLGPQWDVVYNDVSYADGGNHERLAFLFNRGKVTFSGLAGEIVLPSKRASALMSQLARSPFVCGFQAGWAKFNLCTVHIYYGKGVRNDKRRVDEIGALAELLADKAKDYVDIKHKVVYSPENLVLLGDFNIFSRADATFKALIDNGFVVPKALQSLPGSNVAHDKFYDQIAFYENVVGVQCIRAGVFDYYKYVFKDERRYRNAKPARAKFKDWRTYQMSDHLIMWSQFDVDKTEAYLDSLAT